MTAPLRLRRPNPEGINKAAEKSIHEGYGLQAVANSVGTNRWVPQVSLLRPGIPATNPEGEPQLAWLEGVT